MVRLSLTTLALAGALTASPLGGRAGAIVASVGSVQLTLTAYQ